MTHTEKQTELLSRRARTLKKEAMKKSSRLLFAKNKISTSSPELTKQSQSTLPSWRLFQSCNKISVAAFLDCLFDNDFEGLIREGEPPENEIKLSWDKIFAEYCGLMQSDSYNELFEVTKKINVIEAKIVLVENICQHLEINEDEQLTKILKNLGLRPGNPVDIEGVRTRAKNFLVEIEVLKKDYAKLLGTNKEITRDYFYDLLSMLSHEFQYAVKANDITVYQFCKDVVAVNKRYEKERMDNELKIA